MAQPLVAPSRFARVRVLLVEQSEFDQKRISRILDQLGTGHIEIADGVLAARRYLAVHRPHLILLDNTLPDGAGVDLAMELQLSRPLAKIPVVLFNDWPTPFMYDKAMIAHVHKVMTKDDFTLVSAVDVLNLARSPAAMPKR